MASYKLMNQTEGVYSSNVPGIQFLMQSFGYSVYAFHPKETYHDSYEQMPDFVSKAAPGIFALMVMEFFIKCFAKSLGPWRLYDTVVNISSAALAEGFKSFVYRGIELLAYTWVYENYRITTLPFDSIYTYIFAILGVDFGYYWWHRAAHETSIMWAAHHLHHSSDDFTLSTAMRNSFTMRPFLWMWFMHMALLGLPPATFMAHLQIGFLYGGWNHNQWLPKLGKLVPVFGDIFEFFMSTPSHHRVHHGSNKYCIDKNYGFVLMIWDRMFGTYAEEREDEPITYGSITQTRSFNVVGIQAESWVELFHKVRSMNSFGDKLRAIFYGPGWAPGKPRLGNANEIPDVRGRNKYSIHLPKWLSAYMAIHASILFFSYLEMMSRIKTIDAWVPELNFCYILFAMTSLGGIYDAKVYSVYLEPTRLLLHLALLQQFSLLGKNNFLIGVNVIHIVSLLLCPILFNNVISRRKVDRDELNSIEEMNNDKQRSKYISSSHRNVTILSQNSSKSKIH